MPEELKYNNLYNGNAVQKPVIETPPSPEEDYAPEKNPLRILLRKEVSFPLLVIAASVAVSLFIQVSTIKSNNAVDKAEYNVKTLSSSVEEWKQDVNSRIAGLAPHTGMKKSDGPIEVIVTAPDGADS